jgi:hypothetical protein
MVSCEALHSCNGRFRCTGATVDDGGPACVASEVDDNLGTYYDRNNIITPVKSFFANL